MILSHPATGGSFPLAIFSPLAIEVEPPGGVGEILTQDVGRAVVAADAEIAVVFTVPAVEDVGDLAHVPRSAETHGDGSTAQLRATFDDEIRHASVPAGPL
jgi:hypothetical protein